MAINIPVVTKYDPSGLRKANKGFGDFAGGLRKLVGPALAAVSFSALTSGITSSVKAAQEDLLSQKMLARQLKITTKANANATRGVEKYVGKLALATGVSDDKLRPALSTALRVTGDLTKAQDLLNLSLDVSAGTGKPLETVIKSIGRAYLGNVSGLQRLVPGIKKTDDALGFLRKNFAGARETLADPFSKLTVAFDELQEQFGQKLLPYVIQFTNFLTTDVVPIVAKFLEDISNPNTDVGKAFVIVKEAFVGKDGKSGVYGSVLLVVDAIGQLFGTLSTNGNALDGLVKAFEILAVTLDVILFSIASLINQPITGFADRVKKQIYGAAAINAILGRESLFSNGWRGQAAPGQTGTSIRQVEANLATGGIVMPKMGGTIARIAEAGQPEAVIPLSRLSEFTGGSGSNTYNISINSMGDGTSIGRAVVDAIKSFERTNGAGWRA